MASFVLGPAALVGQLWTNDYTSPPSKIGVFDGPGAAVNLTAHEAGDTPPWIGGVISGAGLYGTASGNFTTSTNHNDYGFVVETFQQAEARLGSSSTMNPTTCTLPFGQEFFPLITIGKSSTTGKWQKFLAGGPDGATRLNIYSGTKPTDVDAMTSLTAHANNLLVSFPIPAFSTTNTTGFRFVNYDFGIYPRIGINSTYREVSPIELILGICPTKTAAVNDGVASWFWFGNYSSPSDLTGISYLTGDVGAIGSGSDLELANTTVKTGDYYTSAGFKFTIPMYYTV